MLVVSRGYLASLSQSLNWEVWRENIEVDGTRNKTNFNASSRFLLLEWSTSRKRNYYGPMKEGGM